MSTKPTTNSRKVRLNFVSMDSITGLKRSRIGSDVNLNTEVRDGKSARPNSEISLETVVNAAVVSGLHTGNDDKRMVIIKQFSEHSSQ